MATTQPNILGSAEFFFEVRLKNLKVHFSSETDDWATPQWLFDELNAKYGPFELDVCASAENAKCVQYYSQYDDALRLPWTRFSPPVYAPPEYSVTPSTIRVQRCWMNPPYGRTIGHWVEKAYRQSKRGCLVCCLLPARTDTRWFHDFIYNQPNVTIEFVKGRLKFGNAKNSAPFPSMVVVFHPGDK